MDPVNRVFTVFIDESVIKKSKPHLNEPIKPPHILDKLTKVNNFMNIYREVDDVSKFDTNQIT